MRIAIIYEDNKIFVELTPQEFKEMLKEKLASGASVDQAMEEIIKIIKKKTLTM